ncbi:MAG: DUF3226 domain-containing protein [Elusimicrobiota bacterium]
MNKKIEIEKDNLLLVEGNDDQNFFQKLIEEIELDDIQTIPMGGKDNFKTPNLKTVKNISGFNRVKALGIVRDADDNADNVFKSICTILKECGLPEPARPMEITNTPLRVGILIIPPSATKGEIEDICLASLKGYSEMECIDAYFRCLKSSLSTEKFPKKLSKAKIQAFLASRENSVPNLGLAAQRNYFPLDHDVFKEIKKFLRLLFKDGSKIITSEKKD